MKQVDIKELRIGNLVYGTFENSQGLASQENNSNNTQSKPDADKVEPT